MQPRANPRQPPGVVDRLTSQQQSTDFGGEGRDRRALPTFRLARRNAERRRGPQQRPSNREILRRVLWTSLFADSLEQPVGSTQLIRRPRQLAPFPQDETQSRSCSSSPGIPLPALEDAKRAA